MATPTKGKFCKITDDASPTPNEFPGVNWNLAIDPKLVDWSNFRDGRKKEATLDDATLTFSVPNDQDDPIDALFQPGDSVTIRLYVDNAQTKFFEAPFKIGPMAPKVDSQEEILRWDVTAQLNGTITWPVHA